MPTTENETKVKVGQIFTDEEYNSLKKVENKSEESEGIDWGFGEILQDVSVTFHQYLKLCFTYDFIFSFHCFSYTSAGEDAEEEQIDSEKFQELYSGVEFKDPKKTLRGYYEREGVIIITFFAYKLEWVELKKRDKMFSNEILFSYLNLNGL